MPKLHVDIAQACLREPEIEACGVICGSEVIPLKNASDEPETSFVIDASDYLKYLPEIIYHSHPVGDNGFSEQDIVVASNLRLISYLYVVEADRLERFSSETGTTVFEKVLGR
tara:strand:+ start:2391 stop:2729 length:339 start_codon:yes stop_codon:yes gene_type:complete